jgi:hypothetical protein
MYKRSPIPKASHLDFAFDHVGNFTPPKTSMFNLDNEENTVEVETVDQESPKKGVEVSSPSVKPKNKRGTIVIPTPDKRRSSVFLKKRAEVIQETAKRNVDDSDNSDNDDGFPLSMFNLPDSTVQKSCEVNEIQEKEETERQELLEKRQKNREFLSKYGINVIEEEEKEKQDQAQQILTTTKNCGRIQFGEVVIPPNAPKDLICEECEKAYSVYYCIRCVQVFCYTCCDLCHPRISANDTMHEHEANGLIRGLLPSDTSRVKLENTFYLPDYEVFPEELSKIKDISKPNSLMINSDPNSRYVLNPSRQLPANAACYQVNDLIMFTDPASKQKAYGRIISDYDYRHGNETTPILIRGEHSNIYYIVQFLNLLTDTDAELESILLADDNYQSLQRKKEKEKDIEKRLNLVPELNYEKMKTIKDTILKINQKLKEYQNLMILGPKNHLRNLNFPKGIPFDITGRKKKPKHRSGGEAGGTGVEGIKEEESDDEEENEENSVSASSLTKNQLTSHALQAQQRQQKKQQQLDPNDIRRYIHQLNKEDNSSLASSSLSSHHTQQPPKPQHFHRHALNQLSLEQRVTLHAVEQSYQRNKEKELLKKERQKERREDAISELSEDEQMKYGREREEEQLLEITVKQLEKEISLIEDNKTRRRKLLELSTYQRLLREKEEEKKKEVFNSSGKGAVAGMEERSLIPSFLLSTEEMEKRRKKAVPFDENHPFANHTIDYNLYANLDTLDNQSLLSYQNDHQDPLPSNHRSYEDYIIQSTMDGYKTSHYFPNEKPYIRHTNDGGAEGAAGVDGKRGEKEREREKKKRNRIDCSSAISLTHSLTSATSASAASVGSLSSFQSVSSQLLEKEISSKLLDIIILPEKEIECSFVSYLQQLEMKKQSLLKGMFSKTELIYLRAQMIMKFHHWRKVTSQFTLEKYHQMACKIQRRIRVWLYRVSHTVICFRLVLIFLFS